MTSRAAFESVISKINMAKREIENLPKSGLSSKSIAELDLAYNALNDTINHCHTAMQHL